MTSLTDQLVLPTEQIYRFIAPYFSAWKEEDVRKVIDEHWVYGTIDAVYRNGEVVAVCRWNISSDGKVCDVLDLIIKEGEHGTRIMKHLIARNWSRYPTVRFIKFARLEKYPTRRAKYYSITDILKLRRS